MREDGVESLEGTEAVVENAAKPTEGKKIEIALQHSPARAERPDQAPASELAVPSRNQEAVRSVFIARATALSVTATENFAAMDTTDDGLAVRRAYRAHSAMVEEQVVAGAPAVMPDLLRKVFLARAAAAASVEPRPKQRPAKSSVRKASRVKAKKQAIPATPAGAKKRSVSAGKTHGRTSNKLATRSRRPKRR